MDNEYTWLTRSCPALCDPTVARQAPLSRGVSRQEHWSGLPCPLQGVFPSQGSLPGLLHLMHWQADSLLLSPRPRGFPPLVLIKQSKNPFPPTGMLHQHPQKQPRAISCGQTVQDFFFISVRGHPLPLCAHQPPILHGRTSH